jgi:hypothetical protein
MSKKFRLSLCFVIVLALFASVAQAQEGAPRPTPTNVPPGGSGSPPTEVQGAGSRGSIRGTVYNDANADGVCAGEPVLAGVPLKFVSNRGDTSVYLQSGENGTYGLVAAGLGTWTVTAEPGAGMIVTSKNPLQAFIGEGDHDNLVLGVDFCVAKGSGSGQSGSGSGTVILPTAGAGVAPALAVAGFSGLSLILAGAGVEFNRRRNTRKKDQETSIGSTDNQL